MLRATFAAGPAIIPQLTEALKDDRTAEYAAQSLAFIGGDQALPILWKLLSDPRDLNLRRFTYGALAEFDSPQATDMLFDAINKSDDEPDRTVTECRGDCPYRAHRHDPACPAFSPRRKSFRTWSFATTWTTPARSLKSARSIWRRRKGRNPAAQSSPRCGHISFRHWSRPPPRKRRPPLRSAKRPGKCRLRPHCRNTRPLVTVDVRNVTLSPDKNRALARVVFEDPTAMAYYDFVLEKRSGNWALASVWLGPEMEKKAVASEQ